MIDVPKDNLWLGGRETARKENLVSPFKINLYIDFARHWHAICFQ